MLLSFDLSMSEDGNNGTMLRTNALSSGMELQLMDDDAHEKRTGRPLEGDARHGSLYRLVPTSRKAPLKPAGQWNTHEVSMQGTRVSVTVSEVQVLDCDLASALKQVNPACRIVLGIHVDDKVSAKP